MRGRKPTPTHLKLVKGNPGKRALPTNEPIPAREFPDPPAYLCDEAKVEWGRISSELFRMGLLTGIDRAALAAYCQSYGRWAQAEKALAVMAEKDALTGGLLIKTTNGNAIQNPLVGIANKAAADCIRYAAEFGMTPSARSRVHGANPEEAKQQDPARKYF